MRIAGSKAPVLIAVLAVLALMVNSSRASLVTNGSFATGDFTGWNLGGDSSGDYVASGQLNGSAEQAALTTNSDDNGTLSQSIATTMGKTYLLSYLLGTGKGDITHYCQVPLMRLSCAHATHRTIH